MARTRPTTPAAAAYADAPLPAGREDWRAARWAVVDLETTGLNLRRDEIISGAGGPVDGGPAQPGRGVYSPGRPAPAPAAGAGQVHGIRPADLETAPALEEVLDRVLEAMAGRLLVAHAAFVERGFLEPALATRGVRLRGPLADTRELGRVWLADRDPGTRAAPARARRAGRAARPARAPPAPRARRRPHDRTGVPGARDAPRAPGRAVRQDADGAAEGAGLTSVCGSA